METFAKGIRSWPLKEHRNRYKLVYHLQGGSEFSANFKRWLPLLTKSLFPEKERARRG